MALFSFWSECAAFTESRPLRRGYPLPWVAQRSSSLQPIAALLGKPCIGAVCQITDLDSTAKEGAHRPPFQGLPRSKHASVLNRVHYSPVDLLNKFLLYKQIVATETPRFGGISYIKILL